LWCVIAEGRTGDIELRVDAVLMEARQQQNTLRQLVVSLPLKEASGDEHRDAEKWMDDLRT
jgi:hypothetical protein